MSLEVSDQELQELTGILTDYIKIAQGLVTQQQTSAQAIARLETSSSSLTQRTNDLQTGFDAYASKVDKDLVPLALSLERRVNSSELWLKVLGGTSAVLGVLSIIELVVILLK